MGNFDMIVDTLVKGSIYHNAIKVTHEILLKWIAK